MQEKLFYLKAPYQVKKSPWILHAFIQLKPTTVCNVVFLFKNVLWWKLRYHLIPIWIKGQETELVTGVAVFQVHTVLFVDFKKPREWADAHWCLWIQWVPQLSAALIKMMKKCCNNSHLNKCFVQTYGLSENFYFRTFILKFQCFLLSSLIFLKTGGFKMIGKEKSVVKSEGNMLCHSISSCFTGE